MSDYYDGIDREGEKEQILMGKMYAWWNSLSDEEQHKLMYDYINEFTEDDDADSFFGDMDSDTQLWIWKRENKITEEDMQAKADSIGDIEYDRHKVEGDEME